MLYSEYITCRKPYQDFGRWFLLERKHACLFYKPGKGKTYPCIDAVREINSTLNGKARVLVLSTADAIKNMWECEIDPQKIMPENTVYMSFNSAIIETRKAPLLKVKWDVLIVDECHKVKSHNSKTSKLVYTLAKKTEYVFGLTGTPRGNNDVDIYCQFHNLCVSEWGSIPYTQFVNQCCDIDQKFFGGKVIQVPIGINAKYKAGWERNVAMYTQRIDYDDADDMPDLNVNLIELDYTPSKEYLQAEDGVIQVADYENTMARLAALLKCHQAVNGYLYIPDGNGGRTVYNIEYNKKLNWLDENLTTEPTVIVYRFEEDLNQIKGLLDEMCYGYTEIVEDFKAGKFSCLLLQCARCESFNLQMCNRIIFYTLDYSFIKYDQLLHRVWRMGQTKDVQIDVLTFKDTIETKIWNIVKNKQELSDLFYGYGGK